MDAITIQTKLQKLGHYDGKLDGSFGPKSQTALKNAFLAGLNTPITAADVSTVAASMGIEPAKIWAVRDVEASANAFTDGLPTILYEPHVFSRLTDHKYDRSNPDISSRSWNAKLYAGSQSGRWNQLLKASALDVDAALAAASYGAFQILGSNFEVCGYNSSFDFAYAQSQTEKDQLLAFMDFCNGNKLTPALKAGNWAAFARGYNGPSYAANQYDKKLAAAYAKRRK